MQFKLRSKDIINSIFASLGYQLKPIQTKNTPDTLASDPFIAQQGLIHRLNIQSPIIFDIGANKGETAALYRSLLPKSTIHCFEPFPEMLDILKERFADDDRTSIVSKAVSTTSGTTTFFVNHAAATNSLLPQPEEKERFFVRETKPTGKIEVETIDLDSYCKSNEIERVHVLKMDIQGGELMAIGGAEKILSQGQVDIVYCEIQFVPLYEGAAQFDEVWKKMKELGYTLFDVYDLHRSAGGQILYGDAMFVSAEVKKNVIDQLKRDS